MSDAWTLRPATAEDLAAIVDVNRAEDIARLGYSDLDLTTVREQVASDPDFDLTRDAVVAEVGSEPVASAVINPFSASVAVRPGVELDGLRAALLAWAEGRQRELGRPALRCSAVSAVSAVSADVAWTELLRRSGYRIERFYARMVRDFALTGPPAEPAWPQGYTVAAMDRDRDARALWVLDERAFSVLPDYEPESFEEFVGRHLSLTIFAPEWSFVVLGPDGTMAGSLIGFNRPERSAGYIAVLAVSPDHQRRGLGRALLLAAFGGIHRAGLGAAELGVASDNPRALELYASVGMAESHRTNQYRREL